MELFSIDSGWNVEALGDMIELLGDSSWSEEAAPSSSGGANDSAPGDDGWSVEAVPSSSGRGSSAAQADGGESDGGESWDHGEEEEHDPWLDEPWDVAMAGGTSSAATGRGSSQQTATFNGRALRKAEQQLLSSLPRHMLRRLEAEQREADEGAPKVPASCLPSSCLVAPKFSVACLVSAPAGRPPAWPGSRGSVTCLPAVDSLPSPPLPAVQCWTQYRLAVLRRARQAEARGPEKGGRTAEDPPAAAHHLGHGGGAAPAFAPRRPGAQLAAKSSRGCCQPAASSCCSAACRGRLSASGNARSGIRC